MNSNPTGSALEPVEKKTTGGTTPGPGLFNPMLAEQHQSEACNFHSSSFDESLCMQIATSTDEETSDNNNHGINCCSRSMNCSYQAHLHHQRRFSYLRVGFQQRADSGRNQQGGRGNGGRFCHEDGDHFNRPNNFHQIDNGRRQCAFKHKLIHPPTLPKPDCLSMTLLLQPCMLLDALLIHRCTTAPLEAWSFDAACFSTHLSLLMLSPFKAFANKALTNICFKPTPNDNIMNLLSINAC